MAEVPQVVAELIEVAGADAAWALVRAKGGQEIYIPASVRPDHWLPKLVGLDAARKICTFYRGGKAGAHILVPMASALRRNQELGRAIAAGGSSNELAARFGVHERTVRRHRRRVRSGNDDQGSLF